MHNQFNNQASNLIDFSFQFLKNWEQSHSINAVSTIKSYLLRFLLYLYFNNIFSLDKITQNIIISYLEFTKKFLKPVSVHDLICKLNPIKTHNFLIFIQTVKSVVLSILSIEIMKQENENMR